MKSKPIIMMLLACVGVIIFAAGISLLMAFPVKWCWNYTMPYLFSFSTLTWGRAWCLCFLAQVFFKNTPTPQK